MKNAVMHFKQCNGTDSHYSSSYWGKSCISNFTCFYYLFQPQADHSRVDDDDDDGDDDDNNDDDDETMMTITHTMVVMGFASVFP